MLLLSEMAEATKVINGEGEKGNVVCVEVGHEEGCIDL